MSLHNSDAIQVNADPVSKITLNGLSFEPTFNSPTNIVFAKFVRGTDALNGS